MNTRIRLIRESLGMTQEDFSSRIKLSRNFIAQVESGKKTPSERTIRDICREYGINEEWLRTGAGDMFRKQTRNQEILDFVDKTLRCVDSDFKKRFLCAISKLNEEDWKTLQKISDELSKEG